jgi:pilus assembly protein CpaB
MLDRRFLAVLATSVALATGVSAVFYRMVASARGGRTEWKDTVVAVQAIATGSVVRPELVRIARLPAASVPKGAFSKVDDVIDRAVLSNVLPDEPVVEGRLAVKGGGFGLSPLIPPGMRGVSVRVNDVVGVAGFALPGMRVDVLVTGHPDHSGSVTTTALQDVMVLSAGQQIAPDPKGQPVTTQVVTLLVNPGDAETLTLANSEGHIHLILRNAADREQATTTGRNVAALFRVSGEPAAPAPAEKKAPAARTETSRPRRAAAPPPAPAAPSPATPPEPDRVVVMNGAKVTVSTFQKEGGD